MQSRLLIARAEVLLEHAEELLRRVPSLRMASDLAHRLDAGKRLLATEALSIPIGNPAADGDEDFESALEPLWRPAPTAAATTSGTAPWAPPGVPAPATAPAAVVPNAAPWAPSGVPAPATVPAAPPAAMFTGDAGLAASPTPAAADRPLLELETSSIETAGSSSARDRRRRERGPHRQGWPIARPGDAATMPEAAHDGAVSPAIQLRTAPPIGTQPPGALSMSRRPAQPIARPDSRPVATEGAPVAATDLPQDVPLNDEPARQVQPLTEADLAPRPWLAARSAGRHRPAGRQDATTLPMARATPALSNSASGAPGWTVQPELSQATTAVSGAPEPGMTEPDLTDANWLAEQLERLLRDEAHRHGIPLP